VTFERQPSIVSVNANDEEIVIEGDLKVETCCICLEDFKVGDKVRVLPECEHTFHPLCLK
jgi:hypothetical protein